ncbi:sulfatase-like hydrolase/transferase [Rubrivirga sp. IMCC45206]|uniref:sulfatase-like hydrolase/transferase n=1 Tax=Rubrivirga sp. IMCC45206 TaxID=3391614 RepID=UPI0039902545
MSLLFALVLRLLLAAASGPDAPPAGLGDGPDVIVILADDLGFGDVGYNGSEIATPEIDRLAAEGVVLDRFYVSPLCSPSRAGLLTGRYPLRAGISEPITHTDTVGLAPYQKTLADDFRRGGYETAVIGKWHLGTACHHHPLRHGFDSFVGLIGGGANYFTRRTSIGYDWWRDYAPERPDGYTTDLLADEAVALLSRPRAGPLFLYLPFTAPHTPLNALDEDLAEYPDLPEPRRTYAAMVTALDRAVGRVMTAVQASGRPTLVWFLSDNGGVERFGADNGPLRGRKGGTREGGIRVPSVVWYPPLGVRRVDHPVWYLDVAPTLHGLAGLPAPARRLDGADQSAQLAGAAASSSLLDRTLVSHRRLTNGGYWTGAQSARWKYVGRDLGGRVRHELYDLLADPAETSDLARTHRDTLRSLQRQAQRYGARTPAWASHDVSLTVRRVPDLSTCEAAARSAVRAERASASAGRRVWAVPNPAADPSIEVSGPPVDRARVDVFDVLGRRVQTLHDGPLGTSASFRLGAEVPPGVYVVRVTEPAGPTISSFTVGR